MASIRNEIVIDAPAELVWDALRDVGALHTRLVPGFVVNTELEPGARVVTFFNGQVLREVLVDIDDTERRVAWAINDEPFTHYSASAQVFPDGSGRCRFVWIADLLPNELRDHVAMMMARGLDVIRTTFGTSSAAT
jgi:hypothetical protein